MTDHDPSSSPFDHDPIAHLDFPEPTEISDEEGNVWLSISIDEIRRELLAHFYDHLHRVKEKHGTLDNTDPEQNKVYIDELQEMMAEVEEIIGLHDEDWIEVRGLTHFVHQGTPHPIPPGKVLSGRYCGIELYPHYEITPAGPVEALPLGVNIAVAQLCHVTEDGELDYEYDMDEDEHVLLTMHGLGIRLNKLISTEDDSEPVPIQLPKFGDMPDDYSNN